MSEPQVNTAERIVYTILYILNITRDEFNSS